MMQYLESEVLRFLPLKTKIENSSSSDQDIPSTLALAEITSHPLQKMSILVLRNGTGKIEEWMLRDRVDFANELSDTTKEGIKFLADKLEVDDNEILEAARLTRTLIDDFADETAVVLDGGPEILRLTRSVSREVFHNGIIVPSLPFTLEYYFPVGIDRYRGIDNLVMYRVMNTDHGQIRFEEIFPAVLLFSATVSQKHRLMEAQQDVQAETHEAEGGEPALEATKLPG